MAITFSPDFSEYGTDSFYNTLDLRENEKSKEIFIKDIERIIRTSLEYRNYIKYLKSEAMLTYCSAMNKLPDEVTSNITVEMHHYPFTLYDLVCTTLNKYLTTYQPFSRLSIANEVMEAHYLGRVGIVPLTATFHQITHSGIKFLTKEDVHGNYEMYYKLYEDYVNEEAKVKIALMNATTERDKKATLTSLLELDHTLFDKIDHQDFNMINFISNGSDVVEDDEDELEKHFEEEIEETKEPLDLEAIFDREKAQVFDTDFED